VIFDRREAMRRTIRSILSREFFNSFFIFYTSKKGVGWKRKLSKPRRFAISSFVLHKAKPVDL
jgi:hypothetical protein